MSLALTASAARGLATFHLDEQARLRAIWARQGISPSMMAYLETRDPTPPPTPQWPDVIEYQPPRRESWALPGSRRDKADE